MMPQYGMNYGYVPQQQYGTNYGYNSQPYYGVVETSPNYTGGNLYGYSNSPYGLYGQDPSMTLAESPYARLTGQTTQLSSNAIPNLSTFQQPMTIDMNAFLGNTTGIPAYASFIGATAMQNSNVPLYQTYQQYQQQNPQYSYYPTQQYQSYPTQQYQSYPTQQYPSGGVNNYITNYINNYANGYSNNYQPQQQQPSSNITSMLLSMIGSILPAIMGMFTNTQAVNNNPTTVINGNSGQNNIYNNIINILLDSDAAEALLEIYNENVTVDATGDPHFAVNGQQAFDFQGKNDGMYKMIDNSDISFNAKFAGGGEGAATIIKDQNLEFKDAGINLVSHADGKFEILKDGEKIADETDYNTKQEVIDLLKENDIDITKEGNVLTAKHGDRTISQRLNGGNIDNINNTLMKNDEGLLTQGIGALDDNNDGITVMKIDINKDGVVDDKDTLNYSTEDQFMVHTEIQASSCTTITAEIEEALKKDIAAGAKEGSAIKGFSSEHGYDARQWNEYIGAKLFTVAEDKFLIA